MKILSSVVKEIPLNSHICCITIIHSLYSQRTFIMLRWEFPIHFDLRIEIANIIFI
jgi:hypothetical protein